MAEDALRYDQLIVSLGLGLPRAPRSRPGRARARVQDALRGDRRPQPHALEPRGRRVDEDPGRRRGYLRFVFVGAGYAGVEGIAELTGLRRRRDRALSPLPRRQHPFRARRGSGRGDAGGRSGLAERSTRELRATRDRGPHRHDARAVMDARARQPSPRATHPDPEGLLDGGRQAIRRWCVSSVYRSAARPPRRRRAAARAGTMASGVGDPAAVPTPPAHVASLTPPTASTPPAGAPRRATTSPPSSGGRPRPFRYQTLGVFVDLGRTRQWRRSWGRGCSGFPARFVARTYHLAMMPGTAARRGWMADWTVGLFFGRESAGSSASSATRRRWALPRGRRRGAPPA